MTSEKIDPNDLFKRLGEEKPKLSAEAFQKAAIEALLKLRKELLCNESAYPANERNHLYALSIFLRAYLDYLALQMLVAMEDWTINPAKLDRVWTFLWDCKERIESYPGVVAGETVSEVHQFLQMLQAFFMQRFGPGVYMSPEILVKKRTCSICKDNIKKCNHIPGKLYGGEMCRQIMADFDFLGASVVSVPADYRCRIWPWNYDPKENTFRAPIFTFFLIDDFLQNEEWMEHYLKRQQLPVPGEES